MQNFIKKYLPGLRGVLLIACLISILIEGSSVLISFLISKIVDMVPEMNGIKNAETILIITIIVVLVNGVLQELKIYISQKASWKIKTRLRMQILEKCVKLKNEISSHIQSGEIVEWIEHDTEMIYSFFSEQYITIVTSAVMLAVILILLFCQNIKIGIYESVFVLFAGTVLYFVKQRNYDVRAACRTEKIALTGLEGELFDAADDVRGNQCTEEVLGMYKGRINRYIPLLMYSELSRWNTSIVMLFLRAVGLTVCFAESIYLLQQGKSSLGDVYLLYQYTIYILYPLNLLQQYLMEKQSIDVSVERIKNLFAMEEEKQTACGEKRNPHYDIKLEHLKFSYEKGSEVLKDVVLEIPEGKVCGLGGRTGNGKTTIASILTKICIPDAGRVLIGGEDIQEIKTDSVRKMIAYIPQENTLFHSSLRDNITMFQDNADTEIIENAIRELGLEKWYTLKFPEGLQTVLFENGQELSEGEKQLVIILRVYLSTAKILIFDEITAKMDAETEQRIFEALKKAMKGKTCIIISHNQKLRELYDLYYELEGGKIIG